MDWIRRNWPDMLIGIALVAVIAGIIATLLTGGSFFPLGQSNSGGVRQEQPSSGVRVESAGGDRVAPRQTSETPVRVGTSDNSGSIGTVEVTALPLPGTPIANSLPQASSATVPVQPSTTDSTPTATAARESGTPAPTVSGRNAAAATLASDGGGVYRISVGAFSNVENAARQAELFEEAGYPVFTGVQGALSIVLVGPYDDLGEAERVAERIRAGGFRIEPVIYRFRPEAEASTAGTAGVSTAATPAAVDPTPASSTPSPKPTAAEASGARYLQVGAYATSESAEPHRKRLEGLGFRVTERTEGNLVKLLVGPFAGADLTEARSTLQEQGIEHFPR
jgi:cell division septation protein DedD